MRPTKLSNAQIELLREARGMGVGFQKNLATLFGVSHAEILAAIKEVERHDASHARVTVAKPLVPEHESEFVFGHSRFDPKV